MVRPAQAGGEFQNVLAFSLIAFHSSITLSYFECPNTHQLSRLASKILPYKRVVVVVGSSLQTFLFVGFLPATPILLSVFIRTDILKFIFDQNPSFLDLSVYTFSIHSFKIREDHV